MPESCCFIWKEPSLSYIEKIRVTLRTQHEGKFVEVYCASGSPVDVAGSYPSLHAFLLDQCRTQGMLRNTHTTYYSYVDHILTLRLVMDAVGRRVGTSSITVSDIGYCHRQYMELCDGRPRDTLPHAVVLKEYTEFLERSNAVNDWTLIMLLKSSKTEAVLEKLKQEHLLVLGKPSSPQEMELLRMLVGDRKLFSVCAETPLDASFTQLSTETEESKEEEAFQINLCESTWDALEEQFRGASHLKQNSSVGQRYVEDIFLSFIRLVLNIRDELALIRVLSSPLVNLPQDAFLHLKRTSMDRGLSICQTAVSYVTRLQLGGHSYAPPEDCPLKPYVAQLTMFSQLLDKLQTITEEETSAMVAAKKVISCLTKHVLKVTDKALRSDNVQAVAGHLRAVLDSIDKHESIKVTGGGGPGGETFGLLHKIVDHCSSWARSSSTLPDMMGSKYGTPISGPSPFTFFRTPDEEEEEEDLPTLSQRITCIRSSDTPVCTKKFKAGLPWGMDPDQQEQPFKNESKQYKSPDVHTEENGKSCISLNDKIVSPMPKKFKRSLAKRSILGDIINTATLDSEKSTTENEKQVKAKYLENKLSLDEKQSSSQKASSSEASDSVQQAEKRHKGQQVKKKSGNQRKKKQKEIPAGQRMISSFFNRTL